MKQSCLLSLFGDYSCLILIKEKVSSKCLFLAGHKIPKQIQSSWKEPLIKVNTLLSAAENSENSEEAVI